MELPFYFARWKQYHCLCTEYNIFSHVTQPDNKTIMSITCKVAMKKCVEKRKTKSFIVFFFFFFPGSGNGYCKMLKWPRNKKTYYCLMPHPPLLLSVTEDTLNNIIYYLFCQFFLYKLSACLFILHMEKCCSFCWSDTSHFIVLISMQVLSQDVQHAASRIH